MAGTNGKGSVCAYLRAMLEADGKTTGFFTSPHLVKINERICLNGQPVSDEEFLRAFEKVKTTVDEMSGAGFAHPSYFEFLFGMGMVVLLKNIRIIQSLRQDWEEDWMRPMRWGSH